MKKRREGACGCAVSRSQILIAAILLLTGIVASEGARAAAITFNTALPVSMEEIILREQFVITRSSDRFGGVDREVTEFTALSVVGYGVSPKLALFGILPVTYISREFGNSSTDAFGLGDTLLFGRYEACRFDRPGATFRLSPFIGVRVPTGDRENVGDGSTDLVGGVIATMATVDFVLDSQFTYTSNNRADGFERGDVTSIDTSFQYRLLPQPISAQTKGFFFGVIEIGARLSDKDRLAGIENMNSGGFQVFVTPGLQYAARRWIADLAVRIPAVNNLNGSALEPDFTVFAGIRINF